MRRTLAAATASLLCLVAIATTDSSADARTRQRTRPDPYALIMMRVSHTDSHATYRLSFEADDGLASYDVRRATGSMLAKRHPVWVRPAHLQAVPDTDALQTRRLTFHLGRGQVLCVSVRARDVEGDVGAWSEQQCAIRALDDSALARTGHVRVVHDQRFWGGRASRIDRGGRLALRHVPRGSTIGLIVTNLHLDPQRAAVGLHLTSPARHGVNRYVVGDTDGRTRFTQEAWLAERTGRTGPVVFHGAHRGSAPRWASPLEGVVVLPRWR